LPFLMDTSSTRTYPPSLHDALPIFTEVVLLADDVGQQRRAVPFLHQADGNARHVPRDRHAGVQQRQAAAARAGHRARPVGFEDVDRKSTRLNSSHVKISYAVFCLKK